MIARALLCLLALLPAPGISASSQEAPKLALIIDDLGYEFAAGKRAIELPGPVAYAVLPLTPRGKQLAREAHTNGKEVLLHLPLQAEKSAGPVEPGGLVLDMTRQQFSAAFAENVAAVPHAIGINNHRGSMLTRHPGHMAWLMEEISLLENYFFIDSYTTAASIALESAAAYGVPAARRDVFLDPDRSPQTLEREFSRLKKIAREKGFALGIGHPYPETLAFLERELPKLADGGFELISLKSLVSLEPNDLSGQTVPQNR